MKSHWKVLGVVALCSVCAFGAAKVATHSSTGGFGGGGMLRQLLAARMQKMQQLRSELNLTDDQKARVREVILKHKSEIAGVAQPIVAKRRALRAATNASTTDEGAIRAAAADLATSIGDAAVLAAKIKASVRPILTEEQLAKLSEMRSGVDGSVDALVDKLSQP